jgi:hypothetical protein
VSNENIFDNQTPENQEPVVNQAPQFQIPTEASELVGAGKKYQSVEDALKSVPHAQKHIQTLETELANVKEELSKRATTEELLQEVRSGLTREAPPQAVDFDQNRLSQIVEQTLDNKEKLRVAKSNAGSVVSKFTEKYGEKAEEAYLTIAKESGLTVQQLNSLAASSPGAVLKLAGLGTQQSTPVATPQGTVNTQSVGNTQTNANLTSRVPKGATTRDMVSAWKVAGEKIKQTANT